MNVPDLGGKGLSVGTVLLLAAVALLTLPTLNAWLERQQQNDLRRRV